MNVKTPYSPDKTKIYFAAQCDAVALLWSLGEYGFHDGGLHAAVDELEDARKKLKIDDADWAQWLMARAFSRVRDDLGGWVVP